MANPYEDYEQRLIREFDQNVDGNDAENEDDDLDIFELALAYREDGRNVRIAVVPVKITRNEGLDAQRYDNYCRTIPARQDRHRDSAFFEDDYGILRRRHPKIHSLEQIVVPETLPGRELLQNFKNIILCINWHNRNVHGIFMNGCDIIL